MSTLGVADYLVFVTVLLVSICVGLFYAFKSRFTAKETTDDYLMGGHKMPLLPVALSLLVSFQSAIVVLGCSSEMYLRGTTYWWHVVGISLSALATCVLFVPVFYYLKLISVYQYLEARFDSKSVRLVGATLYILVTLVYLSIALYAPAVALTSVSPFPLWLLILLAGSVCTAYVVMGGIKAVVWTDAIQACFMFVALLAVAVQGTLYVGGVKHVWQIGKQAGRITFFDSRLDPFVYMTSSGVIAGQFFSWLGWYGINQSAVQRYCGMKTVKQGQIALLLNIPALVLVVTLICYCGLVMFAAFRHCDPLSAGIVRDRDMLFPYFVMEMLGSIPGIPGLFIGCLFSGTLSTVSSGLNSLSAVLWEDFIRKRYYMSKDRSRNPTSLAKLLCLMFGFLTTLLAFLGPYLGGVLQAALSTMGAINGPLTGIFLLGVLVPFANKKGAICGAAMSFLCLLWLCIGAHVTKPYADSNLPLDVSGCNQSDDAALVYMSNESMSNELISLNLNLNLTSSAQHTTSGADVDTYYSLSFVLYDMLGIGIVICVAIPVSLCSGGWNQKVNPLLFHPVIRKLIREVNKKEYGKERDSCDRVKEPFLNETKT